MLIAGLFLLSCLIYFLISTSLNKANLNIRLKIFGHSISSEEFQKTYTAQHVQFVSQFGELYESFKPMIDMEQETINTLVLLKKAALEKIRVSNQDVIHEISKYEVFFRNNHFDTNLYRYVLREKFQTTPDVFEQNVRDTLIIKKLYDKVTSDIKIDETKVLNLYTEKKSKAQLNVIRVPFENFRKDAEQSVSEADIETSYQQSPNDYFLPPEIKLQTIKLIFPKDGGVQKEVEMKFKAQAIVEEYAKGADFKELGTKYKFPAVETKFFSKENAPDLGLNRELLSEAFRTPLKSTSEPIELPDGYLVYLVIGKKPSHQGSLEEVKDVIKEKLVQEKMKSLALEEAQKLTAKITEALTNNPENKSFTTIAQEFGLKTEPSALAELDELSYVLKIDESETESFYNSDFKQPLISPLASPNDYLLIHADQFIPSEAQLTPEKKKTTLEDALTEAKEKVWREFTEKTLKEAHLEITYR